MKNLQIICLIVTLLMFIGLACKNNPLAKFTKQYDCEIAGEPEPQTAEEYFKRAGKHLAENNFSADYNECAFGAVSEAIRLDSTIADAFALRGFLYKARAAIHRDSDARSWRTSLELALDDMNEAIRLAPDRPNFYEIRISIYDEGGFLDKTQEKTLEDLTKAIELSSPGKSLMSLYVKRGDYHLFYENYENAVKDYTEAIKLAPTNSNIYLERSKAYKKLGNEDLAAADEQKAEDLKLAEKNQASNAEKTPDEEATPVEESTDSKIVNPNQPTLPKTISGGFINGKAVSLPKPVYPPKAKANRISGSIRVQVEVDENGDVTSAKVISNLPFFSKEDIEQTARSAKFNPTMLSGKPVKVVGVIVYNFTPE